MWAMRKWQQLFPMCLAVSAKSTHVLVRLVHLQNPRLVAWAFWRAWHNQARKHFELKLAAKLWEYVEMVPATSKRVVYRHPLPSIKTPLGRCPGMIFTHVLMVFFWFWEFFFLHIFWARSSALDGHPDMSSAKTGFTKRGAEWGTADPADQSHL